MGKLLSVFVLATLALATVPAAGAGDWAPLTPASLDNTVDPSVVVLPGGAQLVAYRDPKRRALRVIVAGKTKTIAAGLAAVGDPQLLELPGGRLALYGSDEHGVESWSSSNAGRSWAGPAKTASTDTGDVQAATVLKDGTPLFSQDGTGFVNVFQGAAGEVVHNVFPHCCGYAESLAVDSKGLAQIALWSNATGHGGYLYGKLDSSGALTGPFHTLSAGETVSRDNRVPLAVDRKGNTFVAFANGYPTPVALYVGTMRAGVAAHLDLVVKGSFVGAEPLLALAVDPADRLWAVWTQGGAVWAARSRSAGAHFGAAVHVALPGSAYQLEAGARADGSVDAIVNNGSALVSTRLLPGLTVLTSSTAVHVLDDGFPVAGALVRGAGKMFSTNSLGIASIRGLPKHTSVSVTAAGYTPAAGATP